MNQFMPGYDQFMPGYDLVCKSMEEKFRLVQQVPQSRALDQAVRDRAVYPAVVREYDRRIGRVFLALPPEDLPPEARRLLHFGQRRGERWTKFSVKVAGLVETAVCLPSPEVVTCAAIVDLARDVASAENQNLSFAAYIFRHTDEEVAVAALLREVVPMTCAKWGRDSARRLREERRRGKMAGVPAPVAEAVLGMVEEGVFTEERVRELVDRKARMKVKDGGGR